MAIISRVPIFYDRPCASVGLTSYRAKLPYGWIMIGAKNKLDAMKEADRSSDRWTDLEIWSTKEGKYVPA